MNDKSKPATLDQSLYHRRESPVVRLAMRNAKLRSPADDLSPRTPVRRLIETEAMLMATYDKLHAGARYNRPPQLGTLARPICKIMRIDLYAIMRILVTALCGE